MTLAERANALSLAEVVIATLLLLGSSVAAYGMLSRELSSHEVRITHNEEDSRTTARILEDLVKAVAALEERTKE